VVINRTFLLDANLELTVDEKPWLDFMAKQGIKAMQTTDLPYLDEMVARHEPDIAFMPVADFHRLLARGDNYYRGFAIGTSKFTGTTNLPSVLVVRADDPAESLQDLQGAKYAYINKSCSSSYFPQRSCLGSKERSSTIFWTSCRLPHGRTD
jgi:phosphonate transport system substrate-binding protein